MCAPSAHFFALKIAQNISKKAYFDGFWSFLAILRPFLAEKKVAGAPEAFWGLFEVVASGHGPCAPSAHFFLR